MCSLPGEPYAVGFIFSPRRFRSAQRRKQREGIFLQSKRRQCRTHLGLSWNDLAIKYLSGSPSWCVSVTAAVLVANCTCQMLPEGFHLSPIEAQWALMVPCWAQEM